MTKSGAQAYDGLPGRVLTRAVRPQGRPTGGRQGVICKVTNCETPR